MASLKANTRMALFDKWGKKAEAALVPSQVLPTILEALTVEGYRPERNNEIRIVFKNEGFYHCFYYREDDPEFLLVRASFERAAFGDVHEEFLYKACSRTDFDQKVSKAYIDDEGDIVFSVETFLMPGTPIGKLALRMNDALASTISFFSRTLRELVAQASGEDSEESTAPQLGGSSDLPN